MQVIRFDKLDLIKSKSKEELEKSFDKFKSLN